MPIGREQIAQKISQKMPNVSKDTAYEIIGFALDEMNHMLENGEEIELRGHGIYKMIETKPSYRILRGKHIDVPAKKRISFRSTKDVNGENN
jgi:nucleoid DNA-binding protein